MNLITFDDIPIGVPFRFRSDDPRTRLIRQDKHCIYPEGGGTVSYVGNHQARCLLLEPLIEWKPGLFCLGESPHWPGYTTGQRWNGWAMPSFTWEVYEQLAEYLNKDADERSLFDGGARIVLNYERHTVALDYRKSGDALQEAKEIDDAHLAPMEVMARTALWREHYYLEDAGTEIEVPAEGGGTQIVTIYNVGAGSWVWDDATRQGHPDTLGA